MDYPLMNTSEQELALLHADERHPSYNNKLVRVFLMDGSLDCAYWISTDPRCLSNVAFFCPWCGDIWARSLVNAEANPHWASRNEAFPFWDVKQKRCEKCGDGSLVEWDTPFMYIFEVYPRELLIRELKIWLPTVQK